MKLFALILILNIPTLFFLSRIFDFPAPPVPETLNLPSIIISEPSGTADCENIVQHPAFNAQRAVNAAPIRPPRQAAAIARRVLDTGIYDYPRSEPENPIRENGPILIEGTFNGERRLAWVYARFKAIDSFFYEGDGAFVYIDDETGQPLALVTNVGVSFYISGYRCSVLLEDGTSQAKAALLPLALYLGTLAIGGLFARMYSRRNQAVRL